MITSRQVKRKELIIKTLQFIQGEIDDLTQSLGTMEPQPMQEIYAMDDALEHVNQALERLGVTLDGGGEDK